MFKTLSCLVTAFVLASAAYAETLNVTRMDDPAPDGCTVDDCSLREAVIDSGLTPEKDTIMLPAGVYLIDLVGFDNSEETGDLDISTDMDFMGQEAIIDGQDLGRIMDITDAKVSLRNLTLRNANTSLDTNGTLNGGAIEIDGGSLDLDSVTFDNNSAQALGGAIRAYDGAAVLIEDCLFIGNAAGNGASIHADTGITVRNTEFRDNRVDIGSGAVAYLTGGNNDSMFENVRFENNLVDFRGGAIYFLARKLVINGLVAVGNRSTGGAGGVLASGGTGHAKHIQVLSALFEGNMAVNGGAISFDGDPDTLDVDHSSFVDNTASGNGGALHSTGGMVNVTNDTFSGNQATTNGGAIYVYGAELTVVHATFSEGSANSGDAVYVGGSSAITTASLGNNVIDGNCQIPNSDTTTSLGGNLEGPGDSCSLDAGSDLVSQSAGQLGLQPLSDNPRGTPTYHLTPDSAARGQGEPAICDMVKVDQLFEPRDSCNSGAVESNIIFKHSYEDSDAVPE